MTDNTGPLDYAFPIAPGDVPYWQPGMTLLDYFAGLALLQAVEDYGGSIGDGSKQRRDKGNPVLPYSGETVGSREDIIARQAYRYAAAMMRARSDWIPEDA